MCRIVGFQEFAENETDLESLVVRMRDAMTPGGPDDAGLHINPSRRVAMGHRRLSILDLSPLGHQPMASRAEKRWITYNGEIYNFGEIRKELESKGHRFASHSDTEVILAAYDEWGMDCVHKFRGMWAFAIWDSEKNEWFLSRDRMGVKPLYWSLQNNVFMFASELKALMRHPAFHKIISPLGLSLFFQHGYIASPHTIFENTFKLKPGHHLLVKGTDIREIPYWDLADAFDKPIYTSKNPVEELDALLRECVGLRMVSDVPVGVFLSGGVDSTLVAALAQRHSGQRLKTFTIGFAEEAYNESHFAASIARHLGTDHTEMICTSEDAKKILKSLPDIYDEPFADASAIPTYLVSTLARQSVKVALSADGGDEQFCGYPNYLRLPRLSKKIGALPFRRSLAKLALAHAYLPDKVNKIVDCLPYSDSLHHFDAINRYFRRGELERSGIAQIGSQLSLRPGLAGRRDPETRLMAHELSIYLIDALLVKVDRASMHTSLEGREPLLDHKLIEFSASLPLDLKYRNGISKFILKEVLKTYVPEVLWNRPKQGFNVPINAWFNHDLKSQYEERVQPKHFAKFPIRPDFIKNPAPSKKWLLYVLSSWGEKYL